MVCSRSVLARWADMMRDGRRSWQVTWHTATKKRSVKSTGRMTVGRSVGREVGRYEEEMGWGDTSWRDKGGEGCAARRRLDGHGTGSKETARHCGAGRRNWRSGAHAWCKNGGECVEEVEERSSVKLCVVCTKHGGRDRRTYCAVCGFLVAKKLEDLGREGRVSRQSWVDVGEVFDMHGQKGEHIEMRDAKI